MTTTPKVDKILDTLMRVKAYFSDRSRWTYGQLTGAMGDKHCLVGGILHITTGDRMVKPGTKKNEAAKRTIDYLGGEGEIVEINDRQGYHAAMKLLNDGIDRRTRELANGAKVIQ